MKSIDAVVEVDAPQQKVWEELTAVESFPGWNPYIKKIEGKLGVGEKISVTAKVGKATQRFGATVTAFNPPYELRFAAAPGLFGSLKAEYTFHVEDFGERSALAQGVRYSGYMATDGKIAKMKPTLNAAQDAMNAAIKQRVESRSSSRASVT